MDRQTILACMLFEAPLANTTKISPLLNHLRYGVNLILLDVVVVCVYTVECFEYVL